MLINQIADHIISAGGKRLRPMLVMLAGHAVGQAGPEHHQLAAIIEFIHTSTLLHDDVVDESSLRRGRSTANALWGNAPSVLVGDFLYSRSFQLMVELERMPVMQILADATNRIAEGEVLQLLHVHNPDTDEAAYLRVIERKTAVLFAAGTRLGALASGVDEATQQALFDYGMHLGYAFQIADDVLDYSANAEELGKNLGDDLAEGKATLPLIHAMAHSDDATRERLRTIVQDGDASAMPEVLAAIRATGGLEYTRVPRNMPRPPSARSMAWATTMPWPPCVAWHATRCSARIDVSVPTPRIDRIVVPAAGRQPPEAADATGMPASGRHYRCTDQRFSKRSSKNSSSAFHARFAARSLYWHPGGLLASRSAKQCTAPL